MRRSSWLVFLFTLCLTGTLTAQTELFLSEEPVYIPDKKLKAAIEESLGVTDPNQADMLKLTELNGYKHSISDITGVGYATNLIHLNLGKNQRVLRWPTWPQHRHFPQ